MQNITLRIPDTLNCEASNLHVNWIKFKKQFINYITASGYSKKSNEEKVALLLNLIGDEGNEIFESFNLADDKKEDYDHILECFEKYCVLKKNILYERHCFYSRQQKPGEAFDSFLKDVKILAKTCEFENQMDSLIRDRLILGINSPALQEKLIKRNSNLEDTITACRLAEQTKKQTEEIQKSTNVEINSMNIKGTSNWKNVNNSQKHHSPQKASPSDNPQNRNVVINCTKCNSKHKIRKCPAYGQRCKKCKLLHHFTNCCKTKRINEIEKESDSDEICINSLKFENDSCSKNINYNQSEDFYINSIETKLTSNNKLKKNWFENIVVENCNISFKLDTGSDVNVIPVKIFSNLSLKNKKLSECNITLRAYGGSQIKPLGIICLNIHRNNVTHNECFLVVDNDTTPILGLETCIKLDLIKRVYSVSQDNQRDTFIERNIDIFDGLGRFPETLNIVLKSDATPVSRPPRRIPLSIKPKVKQALDNLTRLQIIEPTQEPSDWISNLVVVEKPNGSLRICLDPKHLNIAIKKDYYNIPTLEDLKSKLHGAKYFTVLDLKDGFYQIELSPESSKLCSFSSPFGTYKFKRLPFGINVAPEQFQKLNEKNFSGLEGTVVYIDDILVWGKTLEDHDRNLDSVVKRARNLNIKFNKEKLQYRVAEVKFLGHIFNKNGVMSDPQRIKAINSMPEPTSKKDLQRYLGMINYLRSFIPNLAQKTEPLRQLLKNDVEFVWDNIHKKTVENLKQIITNTPVLAVFNENQKIVIQTDASKSGIGCVLLQNKKPVAFASRSLNETEKNYAQVEKELLAIVYSCLKFHNYIYGREVEIHTDHKPLVSIMKNEMNKINSSRLQRMKMKLLIYNTNVFYVPGKELHIADHLSRSYLNDEPSVEFKEYEEIIHTINMSNEKELKFQIETSNDAVLKNIIEVYNKGWPLEKRKLTDNIKQYWKFRNDIFVDNGLVYLGDRIIVPTSLRQEMLKLLHESHIGMTKTKMRARQLLYWPGIDTDIENYIASCRICEKFRPENYKEPMIPHPVPSFPFEYIGCDIMTYANIDYLVVIDYYSKWLDVVPVKTKQSREQIDILKQIFATHGIPKKLVADNQPFASKEFIEFAKKWSFEIVNTSPVYPRSNGQSEKAVHVAKMLVKKSIDGRTELPYVLLEYRNHPVARLESSPNQILMSRRTRTKIPMKDVLLKPAIEKNISKKLTENQEQYKLYYDKTARLRKSFSPGDFVTYKYKNEWHPAQIIRRHSSPRSYIIKNQQNRYLRRNQFHLRKSFNPLRTPDTVVFPDQTMQISQNSVPKSVNDTYQSESNTTTSAILPHSINSDDDFFSFVEQLPEMSDSSRNQSMVHSEINTSQTNDMQDGLDTHNESRGTEETIAIEASSNIDISDTLNSHSTNCQNKQPEENRVTRYGRIIKTPYSLKDYDLN